MKKTSEMASAMVEAAYNNDVEYIVKLASLGIDINAEDDHTNPLHAAIENYALDAIRMLAQLGADINCIEARTGYRPLHHALENEIGQYTESDSQSEPDLEMTHLLLQLGADPYALSRDGVSAKEFAKQIKHEPAVSLFARF